jgi:CRP-like cAMP-binding protein
MDLVLLQPLPAEARSQIIAASRRRQFSKGEIVFHEGDPADSLHLVASGRFAVRTSNEAGDSVMLNIVSAGGFFGELALIDLERRRSATVAALEPAETLIISADTFHRLRTDHTAVEQLLATLLAQRVEQLSDQLLESMRVGLDRRVFRRLVALSELYAPGAASAKVPLTQSELADLVGGSRPTVNQILQDLAGRGTVALTRGSIEVVDVNELRRRSGI